MCGDVCRFEQLLLQGARREGRVERCQQLPVSVVPDLLPVAVSELVPDSSEGLKEREFFAADPADTAFFDTQHDTVLNTNLKAYFDLITQIKTTYAGTPVGASESIFAMLSPALGVNLVTPTSFLTAISEGTDPTAADKATIDTQIKNKQIKVYVYNSQNANPDVQAQVNAAKAQGIPVTATTEYSRTATKVAAMMRGTTRA